VKSSEIKFSIIIPTYNRFEPLKKTLDSIAEIDYPDFEVVVADDGSPVDLKPLVRSFQKKLNIVYARHANQGRTAARNLGARHATGDYYVFVDDHFCAHAQLLNEYQKMILKHFDHAGGAHIIRGGVFYNDQPQKIKDKERFRCRPPTFGDRHSPFRMYVTNNLCVSRYAYGLVGGFDEDFKEYGYDDSEMGCRLKDAGFRFYYAGKAFGAIFSLPAKTFSNPRSQMDKFAQMGRMTALLGYKYPRYAVYAGFHWANFLLANIFKTLNLKEKAFKKWEMDSSHRHYEQCRTALFLEGLLQGREKFKNPKYHRYVTGKKNILLYSHQANRSGAPLSLVTLANALSKQFTVTVACFERDVFENLNPGVDFVKVPKLFSKTFLSNLIIKRHIALVHLNSLLAKEMAPLSYQLGRKVIFHLREDLDLFQKDLPFVKKWAHRSIVISKSMTLALKPLKIKHEVVYNSFEASPHLKKSNPSASKYVELFVIGTIENRKGQLLAVEALATLIKKYPLLRLNMVGTVLHSEKNYLRKLKKEIKKDQLEKQIKFWGSQSDMAVIYAQADLVLIPSLAEPFGRVAIEAGYYSKPVICSNRGGLPEIIVNGKTGLIFNPDRQNDLAEKIELFLNLSSKEKLAMGLNARERVLKTFNVETMVNKIKKIYEEELK